MSDDENDRSPVEALLQEPDGGQAVPTPPLHGSMEGVVQAHGQLFGERRVPGDIIPPSLIATLSHVTLSALVSQRILILQPEGSSKNRGEANERIERLEDEVASLKATIADRDERMIELTQLIEDMRQGLPVAIADILAQNAAPSTPPAAGDAPRARPGPKPKTTGA